MINVFDAEQLSFKKLDEDNIIWRTINGNKVPIPKNGTREQKAQAIKQFFESKGKQLPAPKGKYSVYSAKYEHDKPKLGATGTGEGANVHGYGQYTQKDININYQRYFKNFSEKYLWAKKGVKADPTWSPREKEVFENFQYSVNNNDDIFSGYRNYLTEKIKKFEKSNYPDDVATLSILRDSLNTYENMIKTGKLKSDDFVRVNKYYLINGKPAFNEILRKQLARIKGGITTLEEEKQNGERLLETLRGSQKKLMKDALEQLKEIKNVDVDVKPAKAEMTKVLLPAAKFYMREDKPINKQSNYVKNALKSAIYEYAATESGVDLETAKKSVWFDEIQNIVNSAIDNPNSDPKVFFDKVQELKSEMRSEAEKNNLRLGGLESGFYKNWWNMNEEEKKHYFENEKKMKANYLVDFVDDIKNLMITHPYRYEEGKTVGIMQQSKFIYRNGESLYNTITTVGGGYGHTHGDQVKGTNILKRSGIKGINYHGGVDKWGNVTFDPKEMKVLEKTTDPAVIEKWIKEQEKLGQNKK